MAKPTALLLITTLAGLAAGAGLWLGLGSAEPDATTPPTTAAPATPRADATATAAPDQAPARNDPAVQNYQAHLQFAADYQGFLKAAASLDEAQRRQRAAALAKEIDRREAAGELALSEALLLQVGLSQAEGGDEEVQKARGDALVARYQALSQQREAKAKAPDPRFTQYKVEEKRIVEEVMAMDSIPDGLSRDQYLRQRLQEAREQAYQ